MSQPASSAETTYAASSASGLPATLGGPSELPPREQLFGWGRALGGTAHVARPSVREGVYEAIALARRHGLRLGVRGAGQSYGDAALSTGNLCLDVSRLRRVLDWDPEGGRIRVEPGVTIRELWQYVIEDGWWPTVVPGTSFASLGGCASANIHGKNAWKKGPIGEHIEEIEVLFPNGIVRRIDPLGDPDLFRAMIGSFGLLGIVLSVTLRLTKVHSGLLDVEALSARNLDEMLDVFLGRLDVADYLVGWVDCFAQGGSLGRGLVHQARYLQPGEDHEPHRTLRRSAQELPDTLFGLLPKSQAWLFMRALFHRPGMRAVNFAKYLLGRREMGSRYREPHAQFAFLLDFFPGWQRAYGRGGMIQYQSFVPAESAAAVFRQQIRLAQDRKLTPFLGVLKRHRTDRFCITHGVEGYSLALEFPVHAERRADLWALARDFDQLVIGSGGRFYLAKDATLSRESWAPYLGEEDVQRVLAFKRQLDPEGLLETDLHRRLFQSR